MKDVVKEKDMILRFCVWYLCRALKKDKGLWQGYKANIAMVIMDNCERYFPLKTDKQSPTMLEWCNLCAEEFLNNWTRRYK